MQREQQYPKPCAVFEELQGLPVIRGPKVAGLNYFTSTAKSGREIVNCDSVDSDTDAFTEAGFNLGLSSGAEPELVLANRTRLEKELPTTPIWLAQVHGAAVFDADDWQPGDEISRADASITTKAGRVLTVQTADCMPIVLLSANAKVLGVIHAGWRSLLLGVIENTIEAMQKKSSEPITFAWIGPAISTLAFEVGTEVREEFLEFNSDYQAFFIPNKSNSERYFANLVGIANHKLRSMMISGGVAKNCEIYFSGLCTYSLSDWFYSYRRNNHTGRMVTVAYLG